MNGILKAQLEHAGIVIKNYETLNDLVCKFNISITQYLKHLGEIFKHFENILENNNNGISSTILNIQTEINLKITSFNDRFNKVMDRLIKLIKGLQKSIKNREYIEFDYNILKSQSVKLNSSKEKSSYEDTKKGYEISQKLQENIQNGNNFDNLLNNELPLFFQLSSKITELISIMLFNYDFEIFQIMHNNLIYLNKGYKLDNIAIFHDTNEIKQTQLEICNKIESLKFFNHVPSIPSPSIYNVLPTKNSVKIGTAIYPFSGQSSKDLIFQKGDTVRVVKENDSGWWDGVLERTGQFGVFPYNYFTFAEHDC